MDKFLGKRLDGRYEIREILGIGGMAVVYKAYDSVEDRIVAIKILREEFATNEDSLRRFKNESRAISLLSHPNIVKIYDVSFGDLIQYIVMEHIEGITLKEYIERSGSLSWKEAVNFTIQILRGLQHAHDRGIVHRDVKPQNMMVLPDGTIKVTDFGIARFARSEQKTITDKAIGSVHYISPEQARGEPTDEKTDIYSLGVMLYEMLTGQLPFQAENAVSVAIMQLQREPKLPTELNGSIPLGVEQITMHAMQKNTLNRYKSSSEMLCDLEKFKKDPAMTFDFTYFVDDSPTRFIDINETEQQKEEEPKQKASVVPVLAGVAATFVIAVIALLVYFLPKFTGGTGVEIKCPSFVGKSYEAIDNDAEIKNRFNIVFGWDYNSTYPYGVVYEQSQPEGKSLKKGATIELYVSMGTETKSIPDVKGNTLTNAKKTLEMQGFKVVVKERADEDVAQGLAVGTSPAAGSSISDGSEITLYVSSGAPTVYVNLPDVTKMTLEDAKTSLAKAGLVLGTVTEVDNIDIITPEGVVVTQDPAFSSGKQVGKGTAVNLTVSSGKKRYVADVTVNIDSPATAVSLYVGTEMVQEINPFSSKNKQATFKDISSLNKKINAIVKIKTQNTPEYTEHIVMTIDLENGGKVSVSKKTAIN